MINFIKRLFVKFLTRKVFVVNNKETFESYIVSHITDDGYVSLLVDNGCYLPVSYSIYKRMFQPVSEIDEAVVVGKLDNHILLSDGRSVLLADINEHGIEDSLDVSW
jgi:hypothetical protein